MFCVALVTYKLTIIDEINDPSAKYINLEKNLVIRRFRLNPSSGMVSIGINIVIIITIRISSNSFYFSVLTGKGMS